MIEGLQYNGVVGGRGWYTIKHTNNCFYAVYGLIDSYDKVLYDYRTMMDTPGAIKWWNAYFY